MIYAFRSVDTTSHVSGAVSSGFMVNTNTHESFREINPEHFIDETSKLLLESIQNGAAIREPSKLAFFILLSFADLKRYRFHYWTAHPTFFNLPELYHTEDPASARHLFNEKQLDQLNQGFRALDGRQKAYFTLLVSKDKRLDVRTLVEGVEIIEKNAKMDAGEEQVVCFSASII